MGGAIRRRVASVQVRRQVRELAAFEQPAIGALGRALEGVLQRRASPEERQWVERIEGRRSELIASPLEVVCTGDEWSGDAADSDHVETDPVASLAGGRASRLRGPFSSSGSYVSCAQRPRWSSVPAWASQVPTRRRHWS